MFKKKKIHLSRADGCCARPLLSFTVANGQRKIVPVSLDNYKPSDFGLQKQLDAGISLKEVSCNLLSDELTNNEISQFNEAFEASNQPEQIT